MRICLMIEGQEGVTWDDWVRLAGSVEEHGLEGLFRSDHYAAIIRRDAAAHDAWATLAGLAAVTERIRLGTMVSPATFRHPSVLARMAVTVDHITGDAAFLSAGPKVGTEVVTIGAAELYGVEEGVGDVE